MADYTATPTDAGPGGKSQDGWVTTTGDPAAWTTVYAASNAALGISKTVRKAQTKGGWLYLSSTTIRVEQPSGRYDLALSEALTFIPDASVLTVSL